MLQTCCKCVTNRVNFTPFHNISQCFQDLQIFRYSLLMVSWLAEINAFRAVVYDCGTEPWIIISKSGYQSGAIEAAKFSNVRLKTWETFLELIKDRWIDNKLCSIKTMTARVMNYRDTYEYEVNRLTSEEVSRYKEICKTIAYILEQSLLIRKSDLINNTYFIQRFSLCNQSQSIEHYLDNLSKKLSKSLNVLENLSIKPNEPDRYISTVKSFIQGT